MRVATGREFNKEEALKKCFNCLVDNGLEKTTTRLISEATGLKSSSLYYWFKNKDEIIIDATIDGLNRIIDDLFTNAYTYLNNLDDLFLKFPQSILEHKKELRLIYQIITSQRYGDKIRKNVLELPLAYNSYAKVLADRLGCEYKRLRPIVQLFISVATNYILWEDEKKAEVQFEGLHYAVMKILNEG